MKLNCILTANYNYNWQQELLKSCISNNIYAVILFKEGISPLYLKGIDPENSTIKLIKNFTNNFFIGSKLLVYNERTKLAFVKSKIKGLDKNIIEVVGIPRFDRYFKMEYEGKKIVFFSFNLLDKTNHLKLNNSQRKILTKIQDDFHINFLKVVQKFPNTHFVIKTKSNYRHLNYINNLIRNFNKKAFQNLEVSNTENVYNLIAEAKIVIGYNSTTLLEALYAGRPVITPKIDNNILIDMFKNNQNIIYTANTCDDISKLLKNINNKYEMGEEIFNFLKDRVYIPDGNAVKRVEISLQKLINNENKF